MQYLFFFNFAEYCNCMF